ncbi:pseudouridine synthase [Heliorestis acidaminivorans]|uniref:pseudouridine synthase n=1 Tax=Heliorestis acidaminivorans TaxID=553427 RepID=UPI001FA9E1F0|nr:pseudouridine synthase [Heliorestis acidaminivorans]
MTDTVRLQKVLASAGIASRREAEQMIQAGRVQVNGKTVTELGFKVREKKDKIAVDGKVLSGQEDKVYYILNKPKGYVTTRKDPQGRPTVIDLFPDVKERIFPVGRLDQDTEGLLLLTNDGDLAFRLTHPRFGVEKTYHATLKGQIRGETMAQLARGVELEDGMTAPAKVRLVTKDKESTTLELKIHEGRNRQVRRMGEAVGHRVLALSRKAFGPLTLEDLAVGTFRKLSGPQLAQLRKAVAGPPKVKKNEGGEDHKKARPRKRFDSGIHRKRKG